ncbi:MAG TPA: hypothetical protein VE344_03100 [Methylomirabilota bacterium]|nr:hypothetical protein [Methylomirabilota bacterium]
MFFFLANIVVLVFAALVSWWLSDFDTRLTGDETKDRIGRGIRCGISLLVVEVSFWSLWRYWRYDDRLSGALYLFTLLPLLIIWAGCIGEMVAQGFTWLIDPHSNKEFDPKKNLRDMDTLAALIRDGRHDEAVQLYETLKGSGDGNVLTMEALLDRAGIPREHFRRSKPLFEAGRLQREGKFSEVETILKSLLTQNPANVDAAMMLMRLYAQDLRQSGKAAEILRALEKQPHISPAVIEYAQRSLHDWGRKKIKPKVEPLPESVEELLKSGYLGTAIEILEQKAAEQPEDFDAQLKLAEAHGLYSGNIQRAKKIITAMEDDPRFSSEQIRIAKSKLQEWREAKPQQN